MSANRQREHAKTCFERIKTYGARRGRKKDLEEQAISEFMSASSSKRVQVRSLSYENQFSFIFKAELITFTKTSHLDSL